MLRSMRDWVLPLSMLAVAWVLPWAIARGDEPQSACCGLVAFRDEGKKAPEASTVRDVRGKFAQMNLKSGLNIVDRNGTLRLAVMAREGKNFEFFILDEHGVKVPSQTVARKAGAETTCWQCGTDASGNTHCWVVPCPVITGPWNPKAVSKIQ